MDKDELQKIIKKLNNHEDRISALEGKRVKADNSSVSSGKKQETLPELIKGKKFSSGQEKIATIVGYCEKILHRLPEEINIKEGWIKGKFDGKYRSNLLDRAASDGLIRDLENGKFDLSQTGEGFFGKFTQSK